MCSREGINKIEIPGTKLQVYSCGGKNYGIIPSGNAGAGTRPGYLLMKLKWNNLYV
jgi:hypothetical protein